MYIILSNRAVSTFFSKNTLAIKAIEQRVKAKRVTNLLELHEPSWLSLNKLFKKFIVQVVVQAAVQVFHRSRTTLQELVLAQNYSLVQVQERNHQKKVLV
jgi:hypothetical protein